MADGRRTITTGDGTTITAGGIAADEPDDFPLIGASGNSVPA